MYQFLLCFHILVLLLFSFIQVNGRFIQQDILFDPHSDVSQEPLQGCFATPELQTKWGIGVSETGTLDINDLSIARKHHVCHDPLPLSTETFELQARANRPRKQVPVNGPRKQARANRPRKHIGRPMGRNPPPGQSGWVQDLDSGIKVYYGDLDMPRHMELLQINLEQVPENRGHMRLATRAEHEQDRRIALAALPVKSTNERGQPQVRDEKPPAMVKNGGIGFFTMHYAPRSESNGPATRDDREWIDYTNGRFGYGEESMIYLYQERLTVSRD